jgi:lipoyl-dependent peroxiredoxin subunit C
MISIGEKFPAFNLKATSPAKLKDINIENVFINLNNNSYKEKWLVVFFYPKDFTFVCPTEIAAFGDLVDEFSDRDAQLLGASTDSEFVHWAWRKHQPELTDLPLPLLADVKRELSSALGILDQAEGVAQRATFIIDPDGIVRHISVNDLNVGRNPKETLRVLDALQTEGLCPCNWNKGEQPIDIKQASK